MPASIVIKNLSSSNFIEVLIASALLFNLLGSIPFAIGLIYIIGDMSYGRASKVDIAGSALVLTLLWMWNNLWQAVYRTRLLDYRCMRNVTKLNLQILGRIVVRQNIIQPFGLILSPLAIFPGIWWATAFFNIFNVDYRDNPGIIEQIKRSQTIISNNFQRIYLLMVVIWAFRIMIILNMVLLFLFMPALLKMLFGINTPFSQANSLLSSLQIIFNSTFLSSVFVTAWLCYSPIEKAIWTVMIFYGESSKKGYDIIANLNLLAQQRSIKIVLALLIGCSIIIGGINIMAAETSVMPVEAISPNKLHHEIKQTLTKREYQWKLPVERAKTGESNSVIGLYIRYIVKKIGAWFKWGFDLIEKLFRKDKKAPPSKFNDFIGWLSAKRYMAIWGAVGLSLVILCWFVIRWWRERRKISTVKVTEAQVKKVDLTDEENVIADDLEENEWLELATRLAAEGKLKLAMRAMFLAGLKALADSHLLTIAHGKTNRDYRRELMRRAHSEPERVKLFSSSLRLFEQIWYGDYAIEIGDFNRFSTNVKQLMNQRRAYNPKK